MNDNALDESAVTVRDKLERYLSQRKTPMTVRMMSDRFMVDPKTIRTALSGISGLVVVIVGQTHWYRRKT
jgi:predicted DNA-binding transcriptional regulator YafY